MPVLDTRDPGAYKYFEGWNWYWNRSSDMKGEGWKLHVSGTVVTAQEIMDRVLPDLRQCNIAHKVLPDTDAVRNQTGEQLGKFLVVYPDNIIQAFATVATIDMRLAGHIGKYDCPHILRERWVGQTVVYTRYGAYNKRVYNPETGKYVKDIWRGHLKPDWIEDPWIHYPNYTATTYFAPWPQHTKEAYR